MAELNLGKAAITNMSNVVDDFQIEPQTLDVAGDQKETTWMNEKWTTQLGYYKKIPELRSAINARAVWTMGKGYVSDDVTRIILDNVDGQGNDTFDSILKNLIVISQINGDSYCEIITEKKTGRLLNLKPMNPETMRIITNSEGRITGYEQTDRMNGKKMLGFTPDRIFHITRERIANEIHGTSVIDSVEEVIKSRNESMADQRKLMHRNVVPRIIWEIAEDNEDKIKEFVAKVDLAVQRAENIVVGMGTTKHEVLSVAPNETLNPMPWINFLSNFFWEAVATPKVIVGNAQEFTEAASKIIYLAFQQTVEESQRDIETQVWEQLDLRIELNFPASLQNELLSDQAKDKTTGVAQPSELNVNANLGQK